MNTKYEPVPVLYDGDMGGDDLVAIMMLLGHPERFDLRAITTVFGNVNCARATDNILDMLAHFGYADIPVYKGAEEPFKGPLMLKDDAFGEKGVGGVVFSRRAPISCQKANAVDYLIEALSITAEPLTIFATGPLTNIAHVLTRVPDLKNKIESIVIMGGGMAPGPFPDKEGRSGNITYHAEFNFFQDPYAVNAVMDSGVHTEIVTMDATQCMHLDPVRKQGFLEIKQGKAGQMAFDMLAPAEALDRPKFGTDGPFVHDPNVVIYKLFPALYATRPAMITLEEHPDEDVPLPERRHGKMKVEWQGDSPHMIVHKMHSPDKVFEAMTESLRLFSERITS